jgi:hypothetical protein
MAGGLGMSSNSQKIKVSFPQTTSKLELNHLRLLPLKINSKRVSSNNKTKTIKKSSFKNKPMIIRQIQYLISSCKNWGRLRKARLQVIITTASPVINTLK